MAWQGGSAGGYARAAGEKVTAAQWNALVESVLYLKGQGGTVAIENHLTPGTTATYDVGVSGTAWRDGFFSRNVSIGGTLAVTGIVTFTAAPVFAAATISPAALNAVACSLSNSINQAVASLTSGKIAFDTEDVDTDAQHSGSVPEITIAVDGIYSVNATVVWKADGGVGAKGITLFKNAGTVLLYARDYVETSGVYCTMTLHRVVSLVAGDTLWLNTTQWATGDIIYSAGTALSAVLIGR